MQLKKLLFATLLSVGAVTAAQAADPIKIGLNVPLSGPQGEYGQNMLNAMKVYMMHNGDTVAGRKIEIIAKDNTAASEIARRIAQELVTRDKVDILAGFGVTPEAFAVAPVATEAKVPMVVMNAATSSVTERSPYIVRTSMTLPQSSYAMAQWALKNGIKSVYTSVSDYGPGIDAEKQFVKTFTEGGGTVVGQIRTPVKDPDFAPFMQKIKDSSPKPDAIFMFVPSGAQSVAFLKSYAERGLKEAGIKLIATGDLTDEYVLDAMGEPAIGLITAFHYSDGHDSDLNRKFTSDYAKVSPDHRPNFMSVAGYDGMHLIYEVLKKTNGDASGDAFLAAAKGLKWESPRGPISIDPETRDIIQNEYIREVKRVGNRLVNVEFDVIKDVKDPGKIK
jgi:branched-chain amino acid transport system substrate-binding protein